MGKLLSKRATKKTGDSRNNNGDGGRSPSVLHDHDASTVPVVPVPRDGDIGSPPRKIVKAQYDYDPVQPDDLAFKQGDKMLILNENLSGDWWLARHLRTNSEGYIPSNYVVEDNDSPETQDWWFSIDRREANKQLMLPGNPSGTFLIRNAADLKSYALSIRVYNEKTKVFEIKHYRIKKRYSGDVFISEKKPFSNIIDLVEHYRVSNDGLCCKLTTPCPKEVQLVPFKQLEVDRTTITLKQKLGAGNFGEVWKGQWLGSVDVAVKTLKQGSMSSEAFLEEAKIMNQLRHRKLVQLLGVCTREEPMYIITELMSNGALLEYLRNDNGRTINMGIVIDMAAQHVDAVLLREKIADGMAYLELKNFIHRDLRAANILVGDNNVVKVADFGLARILDQEEVYGGSQDTKFPIKWTAPEAAYHRKFSIKSDVWSYGILLYEIVTYGRMPYPGISGGDTLEKVSAGYRMPRPTGHGFDCPPKMYEIMLNCWDADPQKRPTFAYLLGFFDDYATETEEHYRPPEDE